MNRFEQRRNESILHKKLLQAYKDEVTDWCHFELAIENACAKTGASEQLMRAIACAPGVWS